jgi:hypothetical protein
MNNLAFVAIKMGRRQGARSGAYLNRYVTDEQRGRRPIFIATLRAAGQLAVVPRCSLLTYQSRYARRSRLEKPPTDQRRKPCYFADRTLELPCYRLKPRSCKLWLLWKLRLLISSSYPLRQRAAEKRAVAAQVWKSTPEYLLPNAGYQVFWLDR